MKHAQYQKIGFIDYIKEDSKFWLGIILIFSVAQLIYVLRFSVDVPWWDQFCHVSLLKNLTLHNIFSLHNEHRIIVPRIFFILLSKITHWNVRVETFFNWFFLQCSAILLYAILKKNVNKEYTWVVAILTCFFLTPQYFDDLLWGFQNCLQINLLGIMASVFILSSMKKSWLRIHLAVLSCIIATFSWFSGLLIWVSLLPLVFLVNDEVKSIVYDQRETTKIIYWVIVTAMVMIVYFRNYHIQMSYHPPIAYPWIYYRQFFLYFFTFLGSSWLADGGNVLGKFVYAHTFLGIWLCLVFILGCVFNLFNIRRNIPKLCLLVFILLTAAAVSFGRANFPLAQSLEARYRIYSVLLPILMIDMLISGTGIKTKLGKTMFFILISGVFIGIFLGWQEGIRKGKSWNFQQRINRISLISYETATDDELKMLFPIKVGIKARASILKELKYSVFRK